MKKKWIAIVAILFSFSVQGHATGNHLNNKPKNETKIVLTKKSIEKQKKPPKNTTKPRSSPTVPAESNEAPLDRIMAKTVSAPFLV